MKGKGRRFKGLGFRVGSGGEKFGQYLFVGATDVIALQVNIAALSIIYSTNCEELESQNRHLGCILSVAPTPMVAAESV